MTFPNIFELPDVQRLNHRIPVFGKQLKVVAVFICKRVADGCIDV